MLIYMTVQPPPGEPVQITLASSLISWHTSLRGGIKGSRDQDLPRCSGAGLLTSEVWTTSIVGDMLVD